ncbi:MAG TPA: biotin transporter BioY [Terracidiphilus sp.]|jgi:biotin transport system substrate-specific component
MNSEPLHGTQADLPVAATAAWLRGIGIVIAGSLFVAACAHVALPLYFTPIPLTLQPFAVLLVGLLLAPRLAAATLGTYLLEGAAGLPVFTPGPSSGAGLAHLFGPTGGYLLAYPVAAFLISFLWRRTGRTFTSGLIAAAIGNVVILTVGALWLAVLTHARMAAIATQAIVPFLPGDALKVATAAALATGWQRLRLRNSTSSTK